MVRVSDVVNNKCRIPNAYETPSPFYSATEIINRCATGIVTPE